MNKEELKKELEGNGVIKDVRNELLGNTKKMAELAFKEIENEVGSKIDREYIIKDIDDFLKRLIQAETKIYKSIAPQVIGEVIPYYYKNFFENSKEKELKYPNMFELTQELIEIYNNIDKYQPYEFIEKISKILSEPIDIIAFSQRQSAKTRVGESLQNHIAKIFDIVGVNYEVQQQLDNGGTIMDFIIPSKEKVEMEPSQTINIECQTTLKDRFRLTTGKLTTEHVKKYLATATGCGLITSRDVNDLSVEKIKEIIVENNTTLVVFKDVKEKIINNIKMYKEKLASGKGTTKKGKNKIVITLNDCDKLLRLSNNKIITYDELILRDINVVINYWNK
ncbi:type II restriction endonuclease [Clostridium perfringens]|uniref:type II restriction endonuclease n=1 Tax=Clostridium perfringens TaxID=1502 RepID=UPI001A1D7EFB|nr:type II restriction endonuclease [Clostridium perfringens]EIW6614813.1 hypothetical protein [Clostridium perfringens]MBO3408861.1 hypothetical protein [Clostridium perfringens]MDC4245846.1 type II restriction endonuclease [Clostridium perfringens]MDK0724798.1 type II restriction endonuclease [Clostridium perfringens]MDM0460969.1 type II restriction endonuclease [Clostridium perfringens]